MKNALTIDVEEWYHGNALKVNPATWPQLEDRVEANTRRLLQLLEQRSVRATFFILGCIAQKHPQLVKDIAARGHEIGTHGGYHRMVSRMAPDEFLADVRFSRQLLEELSGRPVVLFRAPSWSLDPQRAFALSLLEEEGFVADSSLQPFATPLSGVSGCPCEPFHPVVGGSRLNLVEMPATVLRWRKLVFPFAGGFYLRAIPYPLIAGALRAVNRSRPGMVYVHPWELDESPPQIHAPFSARFVHAYNVRSTMGKLTRLLDQFEFVPLGELIRDRHYPAVPFGKKEE